MLLPDRTGKSHTLAAMVLDEARRRAAPIRPAVGHTARSRYWPHQGKQEAARRVAQRTRDEANRALKAANRAVCWGPC